MTALLLARRCTTKSSSAKEICFGVNLDINCSSQDSRCTVVRSTSTDTTADEGAALTKLTNVTIVFFSAPHCNDQPTWRGAKFQWATMQTLAAVIPDSMHNFDIVFKGMQFLSRTSQLGDHFCIFTLFNHPTKLLPCPWLPKLPHGECPVDCRWSHKTKNPLKK